MDKVEQYKVAVAEIIQEIGDMTPSDEQVETQIIMDYERGHFILFSVGWIKKDREHNPFVHIDVKEDGKVWLQHDGTDLKIALCLMEKGIEKKDIVLAFHSPARRKLIPEFAQG